MDDHIDRQDCRSEAIEFDDKNRCVSLGDHWFLCRGREDDSVSISYSWPEVPIGMSRKVRVAVRLTKEQLHRAVELIG